jgi:hypothetical protein
MKKREELKMNWEVYDLGLDQCVLEFAQNNNYKFQAEIVKKEHIFGEKLFGDFDVHCRVFDHNSNQIDVKEYVGMNGTFKGAKKLLDKCKQHVLEKYN